MLDKLIQAEVIQKAMPGLSSDKRQSTRYLKSIPVRVRILDSLVHQQKIYEVISHNVSTSGMMMELHCPDNKTAIDIIENIVNYDLDLNFIEKRVRLNLSAIKTWTRMLDDPIDNKILIGLCFNQMPTQEMQILLNFLSLKEPLSQPDIQTFKLFIAGEEIDTQKYEYFPYSDQAILDFKTVYRIIHELKKGDKPQDFTKYIYAR